MFQQARFRGPLDAFPYFLASYSYARLSEPELTEWAGETLVEVRETSGESRLGVVIFWVIVTALVVARFFFITPTDFALGL